MDKRYRLLHVDDEEDFLEVFSILFSEIFNIQSSDSPEKALEEFDEDEIDAVIIDFEMPEMNGIEFLNALREKGCITPVIFYTGQGNEEVAREAFVSGASDYFTKDVTEMAHKEKVINSIISNVEKIRSEKERIAAQQKLVESERKYRDLLRVIPDIVYKIDTEGTITYINEAVKHLGYAPQDLIGSHFSKIIHPDDYKKVNRSMVLEEYKPGETAPPPKLFDERRTGKRRTEGLEVRIIPRAPTHDSGFLAKTGGLDMTYAEISSTGLYDTNVRDGKKRLLGSVGVMKIITERKRAEEKLKVLKDAVEQSTEAFVLTNTNGKIKYVNPAFEKMTGYSHREAVGMKLEVLEGAPEDRSLYRQIWELLQKGKIWSGRFSSRKKDGTPFEEEATIFPLFDESNTITNFAKISNDVTEKIRLESHLKQAQKMEAVGRLANGIVQDFNNLLTGISGNVELAKLMMKTGDPLTGYMDDISNTVDRAGQLIKRLLAFSKEQVIAPKVINLNEVVYQLESLMHRVLGEQLELSIELDPNISSILIDPGQLEQLIVNLILNARDATTIGDIISIKTKMLDIDENYCRENPLLKPGKYVVLLISDTGSGMDQYTMSHMFEPFFSTRKDKAGLGLATVYGIVSQAGGHILASSDIGLGTTFWIYLPRVRKKAPPYSEDLSLMEKLGGSETILLVENDEIVQNIVNQILSRLGYRVYIANRGEEAVRMASNTAHKPHLLITEFVLQGIHGWKLSSILEKKFPGLKTLFMSGYSGDVVSQGIVGQGKDFISKPLNILEFLKKIRELLDKSR